MKTMVQRYPDRVSVSFSDDAPDVDWIVTVTFDAKKIADLNDEAMMNMAKEKLKAWQ